MAGQRSSQWAAAQRRQAQAGSAAACRTRQKLAFVLITSVDVVPLHAASSAWLAAASSSTIAHPQEMKD